MHNLVVDFRDGLGVARSLHHFLCFNSWGELQPDVAIFKIGIDLELLTWFKLGNLSVLLQYNLSLRIAQFHHCVDKILLRELQLVQNLLHR